MTPTRVWHSLKANIGTHGLGMIGKLVLALAVAFGTASPALAQSLTNSQREGAVAFVLNNTRHTMLHEIGHLLVDQLDLPVLGREEDAVDILATLLILEAGGEADFVALQDTVDGWLQSEVNRPSRGYVNSDFYGAHSLDIQRSYAIACLMVGSDYTEHTSYATRVSLPIDRQQSCAEDYRVAEKGWRAVLDPHRRLPGMASAPITIRYDDSGGELGDIEQLLRQSQVLETYSDWVSKSFVLPDPVTMTAETCGEINAFYVPSDRQVILCYEWVEFFYDLYVEEIMPVREHFALMRKLKLDKLRRME